MVSHPLILAYDIGSSSIKASIIDQYGGAIRSANIVFPRIAAETGAEVDLHELWKTFVKVTRALQPETVSPLSCLAVSSQMAGLVLLDDRFEPVRPGILGIDVRGVSKTDVLQSFFPADVIHYKTGCPLKGIYPAAKWLWLREHEETSLNRCRYVGGVKEYMLYKLTGNWVTDPASASATQWYDQTQKTWWKEMCAWLQIDETMLPKIVEADDGAGSLLPASANELGLPSGLPVVAGTGDGPAANLATGSVHDHTLCISLGTTAVTRHIRHVLEKPAGKHHYRQHFGKDMYFYGFRMEGSGTVITKYLARLTPDMMVRNLGIGETALLFDPSAASEEDAFIGIGTDPGRHIGDEDIRKLAAVLEGTLFAVYREMRPIMDNHGFREIRPVGGGIANHEWMQALANLFQLPVTLTSGKDGTLGAAMIASRYLGLWPTLDEAATGMTRVVKTFVPQDEAAEKLKVRWQIYESYREGREAE